MPRKEPGKVIRSKEASSPRVGDILLNRAVLHPALWPRGPSRYTNLMAAKDDLISCKGHDQSINLPHSLDAVWKLGRRNWPLERHHQKLWQPGGASCCYNSGNPTAIGKSEEENTQHFLHTFSLPGSPLTFHNSKTDLHFERSNSRPSGLTSSNPLPPSTPNEIKPTLDNHQNLMITSQRSSEGMPTDKPN